MRVHRSYLVNLEHIAVLGRDRLKLSSGHIVPMGRSDYANIQLALTAFDRRTWLESPKGAFDAKSLSKKP